MNEKTLNSVSTIGIFGGGQLGRMMAIAASRLGFHVHIFSPQAGSPAAEVAHKTIVAAYDDLSAVEEFAANVDVATVEFENIPLSSYEHAGKFTTIAPCPRALEISQDRLSEKRFLSSIDVPVAPYAEVNSEADIVAALERLGPDGLLKTARLGYDGKGQIRFRGDGSAENSISSYDGAPAVFEQLVPFDLEISCIVARDFKGEMVFYDTPRNEHSNQILAVSLVPANIEADIEAQARDFTAKIAQKLGYVGVLAVEFFVLGNDASQQLIVNEFAPRVHNSGHWTMDACVCDQFENHIRAIAGWPLGSTKRHSNVKMTNIIGDEMNKVPQLAADKSAILHLYGKGEARPGRKMGHVNYLGDIADTTP